MTARFNPLSILKPESPSLIPDAGLIAEALVDASGSGDPFWNDSARYLIEGVILEVATNPKYEGQRFLPTVRKLLRQGSEASDGIEEEKGMHVLWAEMQQNPAADGVIAACGFDMENRPEEERGGVLSTARRHTQFLDWPQMQDVLSGNDFDLADLKRDKVTVYLCLPAYHLGRCHRWFRLFVNLLLQAMEQEQTKPDLPVLAILDEFPVLGHVQQIESAAGQIAGFGVRLMVVVQDLGQIKALYKERWETFVGNAGVVQCFANNDLTTLEWISKRLGKTTVMVRRGGEVSAKQRMEGLSGESRSYEISDLVTIDEASRKFGSADELQRQLVILAGENPMVLQRALYYRDKPFAQLY